MSRIRTMVIDDERHSREELKRSLERYHDFELIAEAGEVKEAVKLIEQFKPELIFLDIQMPEQTGFELLQMLIHVPEVVFITAFDHYAVKAFELNALDYLVKPVRNERFEKVIVKIRAKLNSGYGSDLRQLFVKDGSKCYFVRLNDVFLFESMENYVRIYFDDTTTYLRRSLNQLENQLDNNLFFRINRSQIINLQFIKQVSQSKEGRLHVLLKPNLELELSDRQSVRFKAANRL